VRTEQAFDHYHQAVFSFVYRLTRRADLAEDITQECFLSLIRQPFDPERGMVKTYLFAIARSLVLKNHRDNRDGHGPAGEPAAEPLNYCATSPTLRSSSTMSPSLSTVKAGAKRRFHRNSSMR
jgi:RNA polymerase sigma factor (sigma-70 family)